MNEVSEYDKEWTPEVEAVFLKKQKDRRQERLALYEALERRLSIPIGFIDKLFLEEDDWAYIVKLAVLCEAALTHALVTATSTGEYQATWFEHFSNLQNSRRLELAYKLNIIAKSDRNALDAIAQIRNSFAHEVSNLGGSLSKFFESCTTDRKIDLASKLLNIQHKKDFDWTFYIANTRLIIGVGVLKPIKALAQMGLDVDRRAELENSWTLADLWPKTDKG